MMTSEKGQQWLPSGDGKNVSFWLISAFSLSKFDRSLYKLSDNECSIKSQLIHLICVICGLR